MKKFLITALSGAMAVAASIGVASANTITINGGFGTITCNGADAGACEAIFGGSLIVTVPGGNQVTGGSLGSFSATMADVYNSGNANEANEATAFNTLAGTSFLEADATKTDGDPSPIFTTLSEYFLLKLGNMTVFLRNTSGGALDVVYTEAKGMGAGLSHYTEFGEVPEIPIPGAIWLMGIGLAGLGAARRKGKAA
jgi:hypothetical protein